MHSAQAIGVFDSGIGGMTVVRELFDALPNERIVYFGDTARLPYGSKSEDTIKRYAREDTDLLLAHDVKLIVVACNTVSAIALDEVQRSAMPLPVIGMIAPAAKRAIRTTINGTIGVIGTEATIASLAYERALREEAVQAGKKIEIFSAACPLFVPLAEEGWTDHPATKLIVEEYLNPLKDSGIDTLILGCTHYPVLETMIISVLGPSVVLINSGAVAASEVRLFLREYSEPQPTPPDHLILVSDIPRKFQRIGERFLGRTLPKAHQVVFRESWIISNQDIETV